MNKNSDIWERKGAILFSRELLLTVSEEGFKEIFSNFFPIQIEAYPNLEDCIRYYGLSPHFELVPEATIPPTYEMTLSFNNGETKFTKMTKTNNLKLSK